MRDIRDMVNKNTALETNSLISVILYAFTKSRSYVKVRSDNCTSIFLVVLNILANFLKSDHIYIRIRTAIVKNYSAN